MAEEASKLIAEVERVFSDTRRSQSETASILREVSEHIDVLLESLDIEEDE